MSMSGSKIREQVAHFLVDIHIQGTDLCNHGHWMQMIDMKNILL